MRRKLGLHAAIVARLVGGLVGGLGHGLADWKYPPRSDLSPKNPSCYYKDKNVWLVNDNSLPIVAIKFAFKAGSGIDLKGKKGTANLISSLLDEGAGDYSAREFKKILADNSITLNFSVSHDIFI